MFRAAAAALLFTLLPASLQAQDLFKPGDRVVFIGDTFAEREVEFGYLETALQIHHPKHGLTFRNLAYSADTPAVLIADYTKGDTDNNRESNRALNFGILPKHLAEAKADVLVACFGMTDSFKGAEGLEQFKKDLNQLIDDFSAKKFNGSTPPRWVLVGPIAHEKLTPDHVDPRQHNQSLQLYNLAIAGIAAERKIPFVNLYTPTAQLMADPKGDKLTINGIHLSQYGYWAVSQMFAKQLGWKSPTAHLRLEAKGTSRGVEFLTEARELEKTLSLPPAPPKAKVHAGLVYRHPNLIVKGLVPGKYAINMNGQTWEMGTDKTLGQGLPLFHSPAHAATEQLRFAIVDRNREFFYKWRAVNGEYVYGRRAKPFGVVNFPGEMEKLDILCQELDRQILTMIQPAKIDSAQIVFTEKTILPPVIAKNMDRPDIKKVYNQEQGVIGGQKFPTAIDPEEALKFFKIQEGYEISLFASEKDFPLNDPLAMAWDSRGRLWISTMPSYPHYIPGSPPNDKILILEDTNGDGKADKHTVFADGLYLPTGFEFWNGGVIVAAQPNILFLKDSNGDGKADIRETILHGFGTGDSHHAIHTFLWGPDGGLYFHEGIFHRTNTETPFGPVRQHDAGIYRFQPRNHKLDTFVSYNFANPWGHVFDKWGQNFIADASGGSNYFALPITGQAEFPRQHPGMKVFTTIVRPTCGCELISSRHFPDEAQGNFLVNNNIGFQGIKQHKVIEEGSGFTSKEQEPLLFSTDRNFRPVGITFGPDGALYVVDWYNPLIGHMQFSLRDPNRDHYHGRIWRITAKGRPLVKAPKIHGEPVPKLLELLKEYENRTRYWARSELRERDRGEVAKATRKWVEKLDEEDKNHEHHLLEALWVYQTINVIEPELLKRLLHAKDYHARAAATRALRHWRDRIPEALELLGDQVNDVHPRVRLEAVVALSFFPSTRAAELALQALNHPTDYYLDYGLKETMTSLQPFAKGALAKGTINPAGASFLLAGVSTAELLKMERSPAVNMAILAREGVLPQYRTEALNTLAQQNKTDVLTELFAAIERIDRQDKGHSEFALHDLGHLLTARRPAELQPIRAKLDKLASMAHMPMTRQIAYVGLATADGSLDNVWRQATQSAVTLRDLVEAIPLIPDAKLRGSTYSKITNLLSDPPPAELRDLLKATGGAKGRYVRISLPGRARILNLAEVEVFSGGVNVARLGKATQSSVGFDGVANRAIDGNKSGIFKDAGQTHTKDGGEIAPWWEVDLGKEMFLDSVVIWNRSEEGGKYAGRLDGFKVAVLDGKREQIFAKDFVTAPVTSQRIALEGNPVDGIRLAALNALTAIPGQEKDAFNLLASNIQKGRDRDASVQALRRLPRSKWPKEQVQPLAEFILAAVQKISDKDRTEPAVLDLLQLGNDLAKSLPEAEGRPLVKQLGSLGVQVVLVRTVPHKMVYNRSKIYVEAGKPAVLVLENPDIMPHNLLICEPNSLAEIGLAAEKLADDPNAFAKGFIPPNPKVLHASRLVQPRESDRISFVAPKKPGEYLFICTFPGHWRLMNGILHVVPDLAKIPPSELDPPLVTEDENTRAFVRNWTVDDLMPELQGVERNRNFARAKDLFKAGTCIQCHRIQNEGGLLGPDLAEIPKKLLEGKLNKAALLSEILEPSKTIAEKFVPWTVVTTKGQVLTGIIVEKHGKILKLANGPQEKPREVSEDDIEEKAPSKTSIMPNGLLVTFDKEEILDLLAYLIAGGDGNHPAFQRRKE